MENEFDMTAAVSEIGGSLGFEESAESLDAGGQGSTEPNLDNAAGTEVVEKSATEPEPAPAPGNTEAAPDVAPKTWRKEASAHWASLPSEIKAEILKREGDMFQGLEGYKADAGFGKSIKTVIAPYEPILRANGIDPAQTISGLMQSHHTLATGTPQQKAELFQRIARDYNVDLSQFAGSTAEEAPYVDPTVAALQKDLQALRSQVSVTTQAQQAAREVEVKQTVDAFAANPKNIYWKDVAEDMAVLIQKGTAGNLQEAYDKAIWLNPSVRAKEIARTNAEAATKAAQDAKAKVDNAKRAMATNVQTRAKTGSAATPLGSFDDTLEATLAEIKARA